MEASEYSLNSVSTVSQGVFILAITFFVIVTGHFTVSWFRKWRSKLPPGPVGLPVVGYLLFLGKEPHKKLLELSRKYNSDIIGLYLGSKYTVVLTGYEVMKETMSHPSAQDKSLEVFSMFPDIGFSARNGEEWIQERKMCMGIVKDLGIGQGNWERQLQEEIQRFLKELSSHKGDPVDVSDMIASSLTRTFVGLLFGRKLEEGKEDEKIKLLNEYPEMVLTSLAPAFITTFFPGLRKIFQLLGIGGHDKAAKLLEDFNKIVSEEIENHNTGKEYENNTDFIKLFKEAIAENRTRKGKMTIRETALEGNINNLFLGASDTTSSSLRWLLYLLALHPDVQKEMQKEIDDVLGVDGAASYSERDKIPYTFAALMEAQRFTSLARLGAVRRASSDFMVRGYTIPKGSDIIGNIWAVHNDPKYWPEPEKFKPERFLIGPERKLNKTPESFAAFSYGRRRCPGDVIAWMEILAYITAILQKFNIVLPPESRTEWEVVEGLVLQLKMKPLCFVERTNQLTK